MDEDTRGFFVFLAVIVIISSISFNVTEYIKNKTVITAMEKNYCQDENKSWSKCK